jgi:hypothetical protein
MRCGNGGNLGGERTDLHEEIVVVMVDLEIVSPCVRDNTTIKHVHFADTPAVEARFLEAVGEQAMQ